MKWIRREALYQVTGSRMLISMMMWAGGLFVGHGFVVLGITITSVGMVLSVMATKSAIHEATRELFEEMLNHD